MKREEIERAEWKAKKAKKTPLDEIMERLDAHISVNSSNAKDDIGALRSLKRQIKELVDKSLEHEKVK